MKTRTSVLTTLLTVLILSNSSFTQPSNITPDERGYIVKVGDQIQDFPVRLLDGSHKNLTDFNSDILILNFFASLCVVCRKEIPHIEQEIWQRFNNQNVTVLGVAYKEDLTTTLKFVAEMNITYPVAIDSTGNIFSKFAQGGVTRNVVLDKNLKIIYLTRLFDSEEFNGMISIIKSALKEKSDLLSEEESMNDNMFADFADSDKKIELIYHGEHNVRFEGKIFSMKKKKLEIGVSIFEEDIESHKYNKKTKSLDITYKHFTGMRIAILPLKKFIVPADIKKVIIYDYTR